MPFLSLGVVPLLLFRVGMFLGLALSSPLGDKREGEGRLTPIPRKKSKNVNHNPKKERQPRPTRKLNPNPPSPSFAPRSFPCPLPPSVWLFSPFGWCCVPPCFFGVVGLPVVVWLFCRPAVSLAPEPRPCWPLPLVMLASFGVSFFVFSNSGWHSFSSPRRL